MMADPDSCSMTPPLSPLLGAALEDSDDPGLRGPSPPKRMKEDVESNGPVCFVCLGEVLPTTGQTTHLQSYLQRGTLESLMSRRDTRAAPDDPSLTIELFGQVFVAQLALDENMDTLFYLCRQTIDRVTRVGVTIGGTPLVHHRHAIRDFFCYVNSFVLRHTQDDVMSSDSFIQLLLRHLTALILYMGQVTDLPTHVITAAASRLGSQSILPSYHALHLHLDVRWSLIEVLHTLSVKYPDACGSVRLYTPDDDELSDSELFEQFIRFTLWDVTLLALTTHSKMSVNDYWRQTSFLCSCVKELLILIIKLLAYRNNKLAKPSFWGSLYPILQHLLATWQPTSDPTTPAEADCSEILVPPEYSCADPVGFSWWLLLHMAPLYQYDDYGVHSDMLIADSGNNYTSLQTLLKKMLSNNVGEGQLRCYLRCALRLSELWGPSPDVVSLLWEHFYKRLNEHFRQPGLGVEGLAMKCKTPSAWLNQCRQRCAGDDTRIDSDSSFSLFLRLLSVHLTTPHGGKVNNTWSRVKGRFYTKFHARRMQQLTEVGLLNFSNLFLLLAMTTDTEDVVNRMCTLLSGLGVINEKLRGTVWLALFTAVLLYLETARDIGFLADKLVAAFNNICSELSVVGLESTRYMELTPLLKDYLDSTQDVLEMSNSFSLSQHKLIGSGLKDVLKVCRETELTKILSFCQAVLCKLRSIDARSGTEGNAHTQSMSNQLWSSILPFIKTHACTQTPPHDVADVAASFTLRSLNSPPGITTGMKEDFLGLFQYFGWNDQVNASVSCRFLNHMLGKQSAMERLSIDLSNHKTRLIAAWFRCCWHLPTDNDQLTELTRLVSKLSNVRELFVGMDMDLGESNNMVHDFIMVVGKTHQRMTGLHSRLEFQKQVMTMLGDVAKHVLHALQMGTGAELRRAYLLGGLLAKHCAQLLYVKSRQDCVFPLLLARLALPPVLLNPNKLVPPLVLSAIRENLYLYLQGTSRLDFRRDAYIQRMIKLMVIQYLPRFPIKTTLSTSTTIVHPLVAALSESYVLQPTPDSILFRRHVLGLICVEFVTSQRSNSTPGNQQLGLSFISEVLGKTKKPSVTASDSVVVLAPVLDLVLQNDSLANTILHQILSACAKEESEAVRADVSHIIELFVTGHMLSQQARVMRMLEVTSERCPFLLTPLIPALSGAIRATESKRGVGLDKQLRVAYMAILGRLGEAGQVERSALLASGSG